MRQIKHILANSKKRIINQPQFPNGWVNNFFLWKTLCAPTRWTLSADKIKKIKRFERTWTSLRCFPKLKELQKNGCERSWHISEAPLDAGEPPSLITIAGQHTHTHPHWSALLSKQTSPLRTSHLFLFYFCSGKFKYLAKKKSALLWLSALLYTCKEAERCASGCLKEKDEVADLIIGCLPLLLNSLLTLGW